MHFSPEIPRFPVSRQLHQSWCHSSNVLFFLPIRPLVSPIPNSWLIMRCIKWFTLSPGSLHPHSGHELAGGVPNASLLKHCLPSSFLTSKLNFSSVHSKAEGAYKTGERQTGSINKSHLWWQRAWTLEFQGGPCHAGCRVRPSFTVVLVPSSPPPLRAITQDMANRMPAPRLGHFLSFSSLSPVSLVSLNILIQRVVTELLLRPDCPSLILSNLRFSFFSAFYHFFHTPQVSCRKKWAIRTSSNTECAPFFLMGSHIYYGV